MKTQPDGLPEREIPHDFRAEQATLGSILLEPEAGDRAMAIVSPDDFYHMAHLEIANAIATVKRRGEMIDLVTVQAELRRVGKLEEIGGGEYLTALIGEVATAAHVNRYANIVAEKAVLRTLIKAGSEIVDDAFSQPENLLALLNECAERFHVIMEQRLAKQTGLQTWYDRGEDLLTIAITAADGRKPLSPVRLGIDGLDNYLGPLDLERLVLLKAQRGCGKTHILLNSALTSAKHLFQAQDDGYVVIFSFESPGMYFNRALAWHSGIDSNHIRLGFDGNANPQMRDRLQGSAAELLTWPLAIIEGAVGEDDIEAQLRLFARKHRVAMVVIDYWQAMKKRVGRQKVEEYEAATFRFRELANEFACPFLIASQVTVKDNGDVVAKDSTAIEDAATLIARLVRNKKNPNLYEMVCDKAREGGEFATTPLRFNKAISRVHVIQRDGEEQYPQYN